MPPGVVAVAPWWNMADVESADVCRRASGVWQFEICAFRLPPHRLLSLFAARTNLHQPTMPELSAIALGLNGGCCFAYAVLFGLMQNKLLQMYGVEVRYPPDAFAAAANRIHQIQQQRIPPDEAVSLAPFPG